MTELKNSFYSCLDPKVVAPQSEQHALITQTAIDNEGLVVFYGAEDYFCASNQPFIYNKLKRTPNLDGVIFFTINQFCYGEEINMKLILEIIELGLSVHFAREKLNILDFESFCEHFLEMRAYAHAQKKGALHENPGITG